MPFGAPWSGVGKGSGCINGKTGVVYADWGGRPFFFKFVNSAESIVEFYYDTLRVTDVHMKCARYLELVALCLSDGGIGFSSDTMYIHFTNSSEILLDLFRDEIRRFSRAKIHEQRKPRGTTLRVFDKQLVSSLLEISPSYRTRPCNHFPLCPVYSQPNRDRFGFHNHFIFKSQVFAEITVPEELVPTQNDKAQFMKIYSSCDGYPSIFPRQQSWSAVERMVAVVCHHPRLKQRLHEILSDLDVPHRIKQYSLEMRSQEAISRFKERIGFVEGVTMTGNSRYWRSYQKNEVLDIIQKSYGVRFDSRNRSEIIARLKKLSRI